MGSIGQRIRMVRQGVSRASFAQQFGISPVSLKRYEDGVREPDSAFLDRLISDQNLSRSWLVYGEGAMYNSQTSKRQTDRHVGYLNGSCSNQHTEDIEYNTDKTTDTSVVLNLQQEIIGLLKEKNLMAQENADLRIQLDRRDMRIRELERELDALKEARKGVARAQDQTEQLAS